MIQRVTFNDWFNWINIDVDNIELYKINIESVERLNKLVEKPVQVMIDAIGRYIWGLLIG